MWWNLCNHGCNCLPNVVGIFLKTRLCVQSSISFPKIISFLCLMILQVKRHQKKEKQVVLSTSLNISREKFIRTCMYVGSHKLSEVLFTFYSSGSVMEIVLCVCTVHTYVRYVTMVVFVRLIFPINWYILLYGTDSQKFSLRLHARTYVRMFVYFE